MIESDVEFIVDRWVRLIRSKAILRGRRGTLSRGIRENLRVLVQAILAVADDSSRLIAFADHGNDHRRARSLATMRRQNGLTLQDHFDEFIELRVWLEEHVRMTASTPEGALASLRPVNKAVDLVCGAAVVAFHEFEVEKLVRLIALDPLTGLHDYGHFWERLEQEIVRAKRHGGTVSVIMIDVDGFKTYNDRCGHLWGDSALRRIAEILRSISRRSDILARYGGDEFVLILPETSHEGAAAIAERTRNEFAQHRFATEDGQEIALAISLGCATSIDGAIDGRQLVAQADSALYQAKRTGKNRIALFGGDESGAGS